jgi:predicted ATPase
MLSRIEIENFRSMEQVEIPLRPLNVLIGPNGSGKSNLLDVFALMAEAAAGKLSDGIANRGGFDSVLFRGASESKIFFGFDFSADAPFQEEGLPIQYKLQVRKTGNIPRVAFEQVSRVPEPPHTSPFMLVHRRGAECRFMNKLLREKEDVKGVEDEGELAIWQVKDETAYPTPYKILRSMETWMPWGPVDVSASSPVRQAQVLRSGLRLSKDASNLASVLHAIQQQNPTAWEDVIDRLRGACPGFKSLTMPSELADGKLVLRFWEEPFGMGSGFSANMLSDGTLRLLTLVALLASPSLPPVICIDEPEIGLHPDWIKLVAEMASSASARTQLIIATHSPTLISKLAPEEVVVVEKKEGRTTAKRLEAKELAGWVEKFQLGDLWLSGVIGGRS